MGEVEPRVRFRWWVFLLIGLLIGGIVVPAAIFLSGPRPGVYTGGQAVMSEAAKEEPLMAKGTTAPGGMGTGGERLVVRRKTLRLEVKDAGAAYAAVEKIADKNGGFIISASLSSPDGGPVYPLKAAPEAVRGPLSGTIVLKVPVQRYGAAIKELKGLGKLRSEEETAEEVTERHIDLNARLRNLKRQEERYLEILDSAVKVEEMLKVEEQLVRIRGEIESLQAQVEYLEKSAAMATITLELSEPASVAMPLIEWGLGDAFKTALRGFVAVVNFFIIAAGTLLPLAIGGLLVWLVVTARRKRRE
ncbi:MAG: DUF4349 domain-containing protein [Bacillota bacterium]